MNFNWFYRLEPGIYRILDLLFAGILKIYPCCLDRFQVIALWDDSRDPNPLEDHTDVGIISGFVSGVQKFTYFYLHGQLRNRRR